jgi:hypothetical protein
MSPPPDKQSLLDKLRAQSAALQQEEGAKRRPVEEASTWPEASIASTSPSSPR